MNTSRPQIIELILKELASRLSPKLSFHNLEHTQDVLTEVEVFSGHDHVPAHSIELLQIAAAFHDSGYLTQFEDNEPIGAEIAMTYMQRANIYTNEQIRLVKKMILDTSIMPTGALQKATTPISGYLLDADVSNFGRKDFFDRSLLIMQERGETDEIAFWKSTAKLLERHSWFTSAAKALRESQKQINLRLLRDRIKKS